VRTNTVKKRTLLPVPIAIVALLAAACGGDEDTASPAGDTATRSVEITMTDIAFEPTSVEVEAGETVRFVFTNAGEVDHDAFIGDGAAQAEHEAAARDAHGGHDGGDADAITVAPGDIGELTHTFGDAGTLEIGCHEPGHYAAGMRIDVTVA